MRKLGNGGGGEGWAVGGNEPGKPEKSSGHFGRSPERAFFVSAALTVFCFLGHILFLLLTEPSRYSTLSKESAFAYSSIPLFIGMVFFVTAILTFRKIRVYSAFHIIGIILVIVFGSLTVHGLIGFVTHLLQTSYGL
jgi:hypothetical protein